MFKKIQEKLRDKNRTKRAFLCVDLGDIKGLLACLDDGFDINTARPNHKVYHGKSFLLETVSSLAYKNKNWPMLKALIEYAGSANNIIFGDYIGSEDGGPSFRTGINGPPDPALWDNLANKTYEHSPLHFCLWHMCGPEANVQDFRPGKLDFGFGSMFTEEAEGTFFAFLRNCAALDQRKLLGEQMSARIENKPKGLNRKI